MPFSIETERLVLRDLHEGDAKVIAEQFTEPSIRNQILAIQADKAYQFEYVRRAIIGASNQTRDYFALAITLKNTDIVIGMCSIYNVFPQGIDAEIGWNLGKEFSGNGYDTEASKALLRIGFELNDVQRISADCFVDNKVAIRVLEKIGMTPYDSDLVSR